MVLAGSQRAAAYFDWADRVTGDCDPAHQLFGDGGVPRIAAAWYRDFPAPGWGTGFTYGASLYGHSGVEFLVVVKDPDPIWIWAIAHFIDVHRDAIGSVAEGDTINWRDRVAPTSLMDAFVVTEVSSLPAGEHLVHLDDNDHVRILQAVPAYAQELPLVRELGPSAWLQRLGARSVDPSRPPLIDAHSGRVGDADEIFRFMPWPFDGDTFPSSLGAVVQLTVLDGSEPARGGPHQGGRLARRRRRKRSERAWRLRRNAHRARGRAQLVCSSACRDAARSHRNASGPRLSMGSDAA